MEKIDDAMEGIGQVRWHVDTYRCRYLQNFDRCLQMMIDAYEYLWIGCVPVECLQMFTDVYGLPQMFMDSYRLLQVSVHAYTCGCMLMDVLSVIPDVYA